MEGIGKREKAQELIKLLPVLNQLRGEGGLRQSELRDRTRYSKSTVHRRIKNAENCGLVCKRDGGYYLTELGNTMADKASEFVSEVECAHEYKEFLDTLGEEDLDVTSISDAEVTHASPTNPVAPLMRLAVVTMNSSEARVVTSSIAPESFELGREKLRDGRLEVDMVIDRQTIETVKGSEWFGEKLRQDLRTDNFDLWIHEEDIPYQVGVMDEKLCLGAEDESGMPVALLETRSEEAVRWGTSLFEEYRKGSERLEPSDV